jgi:hypothetical protein
MKAMDAKGMIIFVMILALITVSPGVSMANTNGDDTDKLRLAIEDTALSREEKASLLSRGYEAVNAGIPSSDIVIIIKRGVARGWGKEAIERAITLAMEAKKQHLPAKCILNRLHQGLAKGVPSERVLSVTGRLMEKLVEADRIVNNLMIDGLKTDRGMKRDHAVETVAWALERAIPGDTIMNMGERLIRSERALSMFNASVTTMTIFIEMGMPIERASKLINSAIEKGYTEKEMAMMERELHNNLRDGWNMEDAARRMESLINRGGIGSSWMGSGAGMGGSPGMNGMGGSPGGGMGSMGGGTGMGGRGGMGGGRGGR